MEIDDDTIPPESSGPQMVKTGGELDNTEWDVVIAGTGIQQSLLALALSRSGKRVLHIDKNDWYGGAEAAFSLDEAKDWAATIGESPSSLHGSLYFDDASIERPEPISDQDHEPRLSFSRAYSLALAPQVIYTSARLLDVLVSSKSHRQLEFLAMGSWWVYSRHDAVQNEPSSSVDKEQEANASEASTASSSKLLRIPTNREDVAFSDSGIDIRAKRSLMKVLRFILDFEEQRDFWDSYRDSSFSEFLSLHFKLPQTLQPLLIALTLTPFPPSKTTTGYALPRIARHLRSTGKLGPGFSSVVPRWGGVSEIIQVACRAAAVGGATYALDRGINSDAGAVWADAGEGTPKSRTLDNVQVGLEGEGAVKTNWIVGDENDMSIFQETTKYEEEERPSNDVPSALTKAIAIVSSPLKSLFPVVEGAQAPAGAIVVFPTGSLTISDQELKSDEIPPVYLIIHSSDTGECPAGQSVLYASTALSKRQGKPLLRLAVEELLRIAGDSMPPSVLWRVQYEQHNNEKRRDPSAKHSDSEHVALRLLKFPAPSLDLVFDDGVLDAVKWAWLKIMGTEANPDEFLVFPDREGTGEEDLMEI